MVTWVLSQENGNEVVITKDGAEVARDNYGTQNEAVFSAGLGFVKVFLNPLANLSAGKYERLWLEVGVDSITVDGVDVSGQTSTQITTAINTLLKTDVTP